MNIDERLFRFAYYNLSNKDTKKKEIISHKNMILIACIY